MKSKLIIVLLMICYCHSQDSNIEPLRLFPMHIGDMWQYKTVYYDFENNPYDTAYFSWEIYGDTLMSNGMTYFKKRLVDSPYTQYYRIDTASSVVKKYEEESCEDDEFELYPLLVYNDTTTTWNNCLGWQYSVTFSDSGTMEVYYDWLLEEIYEFREDLGLYLSCVTEGTSGCTNLIAAIVDGEQYGEFVNIIESTNIPDKFELGQNYPNPFNASTTIPIILENSVNIDLSIYNLNGEFVCNIESGYKSAGSYTFEWNAEIIPSGIYFTVLDTESYRSSKKLMLLK